MSPIGLKAVPDRPKWRARRGDSLFRLEIRHGLEVGNAELIFDPGANSHNASGQLDSANMVGVDRWPLVIYASHMPTTSQADLAELDAILASMSIS
jgi:hypothetical protein